ncbi:MAG: hypothetical protein HY707_10430 [Ignavibacteriae bacterium]|nr:hypothetical protein [Ignavibacteriota bacterium]
MVKHIQVHISEALSEEEWKILHAFYNKARFLTTTTLVSTGASSIDGKIRYEQDEGLRFEATLPPKEQIAEFLMAFRFFYLQREPTYFPKILKLIGKHAPQSEVQQALNGFRNQWQYSLFKNTIKIKLNGKPITSSVLLDLWFNAYYFHADEDKQLELQKLRESLSEDFTKYMLLDAVYEATKVILKVYYGLRGIVEEHFSNP